MLTAIAIATLLVLAVVVYMWWMHPFTRCQRLAAERGLPGFSDAQNDAWSDDECDKWPGIP